MFLPLAQSPKDQNGEMCDSVLSWIYYESNENVKNDRPTITSGTEVAFKPTDTKTSFTHVSALKQGKYKARFMNFSDKIISSEINVKYKRSFYIPGAF